MPVLEERRGHQGDPQSLAASFCFSKTFSIGKGWMSGLPGIAFLGTWVVPIYNMIFLWNGVEKI